MANGNMEPEVCAHHHARHEVRCCSDAQQPGWRHRSRCPWAASKGFNAGVVACQRSKTYAEAVAHCALVGARLCTSDELARNCAKGTGCGMDAHMIWTGDAGIGTEVVANVDPAQPGADSGHGASSSSTSTVEPPTPTSVGSSDAAEDEMKSTSAAAGEGSGMPPGAIAALTLLSVGIVAALGGIMYRRRKRTRLPQESGGMSTAGSVEAELARGSSSTDPRSVPRDVSPLKSANLYNPAYHSRLPLVLENGSHVAGQLSQSLAYRLSY